MSKQDKKYKQLLREVVMLQKENKLLTMAEDMIYSYQNEQYEEWSDD